MNVFSKILLFVKKEYSPRNVNFYLLLFRYSIYIICRI